MASTPSDPLHGNPDSGSPSSGDADSTIGRHWYRESVARVAPPVARQYFQDVRQHLIDDPITYSRFLELVEMCEEGINVELLMDGLWRIFMNCSDNQFLVHGFNIFLPTGYRLECGVEPDIPNTVRVVTPRGVEVHKTECLWLSPCSMDTAWE